MVGIDVRVLVLLFVVGRILLLNTLLMELLSMVRDLRTLKRRYSFLLEYDSLWI